MSSPLLARPRLAPIASALLAFVLCSSLSASPEEPKAIQPKRIAYILAGQSNIKYLDLALTMPPCLTTAPANNVRYFDYTTTTFPLTWLPPTTTENPALQYLGDRLGNHHAGANVDLYMMAWPGSAMFEPNKDSNFLTYWINPANLTGDPFALVNATANLLNAVVADEIHIIWGQGETDCMPGVPLPVSADMYTVGGWYLFSEMTAHANKTVSEVHLVTIGTIDSPAQGADEANAIRDGYVQLDRLPFTPPGQNISIETVAHHYDLPHTTLAGGGVDPYHLSECGYMNLAERIAYGIINPTHLTEFTAPPAQSGTNGIVLTTNQTLQPAVNPTAYKNYFEVTYGNPPSAPQTFTLSITGSQITLNMTNPVVAPFRVRHIPGSGHNADWFMNPILSVHGTLLEPIGF